MHGLPQKIGQLLAFSELENSSPLFTRLTEDAPTLSFSRFKAALSDALGRPWRDCFSEIDSNGISASIGQVHRARTADGCDVAIKLQYPGIAEMIDADLRALGWLIAPVGDLKRGFDVDAYRSEIGTMLRAEVDYVAEARTLERFGTWTRGLENLSVPGVVNRCSGATVLTTSWIDGERLAEAVQWSEQERTAAASAVLGFFLHGVFAWRCVHADPHPGNYRFTKSERGVRVGVLDFGCAKDLEERFVCGMRGLLEDAAGHEGTAAQLDDVTFGHLVAMGFNAPMLEPMRQILGRVALLLAEPFRDRCAVDVTEWNVGARLKELLGPHRMSFRLAGPPSMIFFLRTFQGTLHYLRAFKVRVPWREVWDQAVARTDGVSPVPAVRTAEDRDSGIMRANALHIQVREGEATRVAMTFDPGATDHLPALVPVELSERLRRRSIDLVQIAADARRRDYAPGDLFALEEDGRSVRVWLA